MSFCFQWAPVLQLDHPMLRQTIPHNHEHFHFWVPPTSSNSWEIIERWYYLVAITAYGSFRRLVKWDWALNLMWQYLGRLHRSLRGRYDGSHQLAMLFPWAHDGVSVSPKARIQSWLHRHGWASNIQVGLWDLVAGKGAIWKHDGNVFKV